MLDCLMTGPRGIDSDAPEVQRGSKVIRFGPISSVNSNLGQRRSDGTLLLAQAHITNGLKFVVFDANPMFYSAPWACD